MESYNKLSIFVVKIGSVQYHFEQIKRESGENPELFPQL
jgi:hypothetical protein